MKVTEVFELRTEEEVMRFCKMLLGLKRRAPNSLSYQVALTAARKVEFKHSKEGNGAGKALVPATIRKAGKL